MTPTRQSQSDPATRSDPGIVASQVERAVEAQRNEAQASQRELGRNSNGDFTLYSDDVAAVGTQFSLTTPEAEQYLRRTVDGGEKSDSVLDDIRRGRVIYRQAYEQVYNDPSNALTAETIRAARVEKERREALKLADERKAALTAPTADRTQPEAGPWGPYADYAVKSTPIEEVAHNASLPVDVVKESGVTQSTPKERG